MITDTIKNIEAVMSLSCSDSEKILRIKAHLSQLDKELAPPHVTSEHIQVDTANGDPIFATTTYSSGNGHDQFKQVETVMKANPVAMEIIAIQGNDSIDTIKERSDDMVRGIKEMFVKKMGFKDTRAVYITIGKSNTWKEGKEMASNYQKSYKQEYGSVSAFLKKAHEEVIAEFLSGF